MVTLRSEAAPMPASAPELTAAQARRLALRAQRLIGAPDRRGAGGGAAGLVRTLGAVQLDTISVLARSHELVAYARLGAIGRERVEDAYWGGEAFEYWAHAASVVPLSSWPLWAFRRRHYRGRAAVWGQESPATGRGGGSDVLARLRAEGPLTATQLGGAKNGTSWWGWSDVKHTVEYLLATGEVICHRRTGWRRVYDLPERVVPADLLHDDLDDDSCQVQLIALAATALGVATAGDLADYFRLKRADVVRLVSRTDLTPVRVEFWRDPAWADPHLLAEPTRGRHRTTLLSPFDSLVWDRKRTARVFGFDHRLEAYVPKHKRTHGYFTMPVLAGGELIARLDPARVGGTLVARHLALEPAAARPARLEATAAAIQLALREAATWVGCDEVCVERVQPEAARAVVLRGLQP